MKKVRFIGLDVHAETIAVAAAEPSGEVRSLGIIPNRPESIRKLWVKPALLVSGSSRRITIMRFRPANIRVINRRDSHLDRLRCCFRNHSKIELT